MNPRRWLQEHSLKLLAIRDTPEAIAGGVAVGLFFSLTPLFGLKTALTFFFTWVTRSNLVAAFLTLALHNVAIPLMPLLYRGEYDVGYWFLSQPHHWPPPLLKTPWESHKWLDTIFASSKDLLLGSLVFAAPTAIVAFFITRKIVTRHHAKRPHTPSDGACRD